ncbi:MAG TPA: tRNA 2-thiouridine(34) synthase MnmA, partial [Acidobacteriota bacterium]|nr:tRNA 2-thiouridine(34) synthase MnmA [Acidobacteriota bacterium]
LLRQEGHEVVGLTLQLWDYGAFNTERGLGRCCSPADIADARAVAAQLDFPHYVFDHTSAFQAEIVEPFLDAYAAGDTPSPCIRCNRKVKFGLLRRLASSLGAESLATGHYARLSEQAGRPVLRKGVDAEKDQSYFLFDVPAAQLRDVRFPIGALSKHQVREEARRLDLRVADKAESYELCFIPDGDKNAFVERYRPAACEERIAIRDVSGRSLGHTNGLHRFTVGQRRGLGVNGGDRLYVLNVDADAASVTVGPPEGLESTTLLAEHCNWLAIDAPQSPLRVRARIRHRHREAEAIVVPMRQGCYEVRFSEPQRAVTPGQGVAFYDGDVLLGGGWISRRSDDDGEAATD